MFTLTELDGKSFDGPKTYPSSLRARKAAREAVKAAQEPLYIAILGTERVVYVVAHIDHREQQYADEVVTREGKSR